MKKHTTKLCFITAITLLLCSCKKQPAALPGATHTGQNVVACYTNGTAFIVSGHTPTGMGFFYDGVNYDWGWNTDSTLSIKAIAWSNKSVQLYIKYHGLGTYNITADTNNQPAYAYYNDTGIVSYAGINGSVTVDYYDGNVVAGKFSFDGKSANGNIMHVTNGEFDIAGKEVMHQGAIRLKGNAGCKPAYLLGHQSSF